MSEMGWLSLVHRSHSPSSTRQTGWCGGKGFPTLELRQKDKDSNEFQVNLFLYSMGRDVEPIGNFLVFPLTRVVQSSLYSAPRVWFQDCGEKSLRDTLCPDTISSTTVPASIRGTRGRMRPWKRLCGAYTSCCSTASLATVSMNRSLTNHNTDIGQRFHSGCSSRRI